MRFFKFCIILICYIFVILINIYAADAAVYDGPFIVEPSQPFVITCVASQFDYVKWHLDGQTLDDRQDLLVYHWGSNGTHRISEIRSSSTTLEQTGLYRCTNDLGDAGHLVEMLGMGGSSINLTPESKGTSCPKQSQTSSYKCVVAVLFEPFTIACKPDSTIPNNLTLIWRKRDQNSTSAPYNAVEESKRVRISGNQIEFVSVIVDDAGVYSCQLVKKDNEKLDTTPESQAAIELQYLPYMKATAKDLTVIEENQINVTCVVFGTATQVNWKIDNRSFTESQDRVELREFNGTKNGMLLIKSANLTTDRGNYTCTAESSVGMSSNVGYTYVRIKGKYAALWPFIGICIEVLILCTVILIYEKKRDKTELEESDTDQGPETKSSPDHGQDSVRYRK